MANKYKKKTEKTRSLIVSQMLIKPIDKEVVH